MRDGYIATFIGITIGATAFGFNIETRNSDAEARGRFRKFKIVDILQLGGYTRLFKLSSQAAPILPPVPPGSGGSNQPLIWSIEVKQPFLQIARRYSPLPIIQPGHDTHQDDDQALQLYVSGQHAGEMSRYIFSLPPGASLEARGPFVEYHIEEALQELVLIAGGTGIAPLLQAATVALTTSASRVHILWANRCSDACKGAHVEVSTNWLSLTSLRDCLRQSFSSVRSEIDVQDSAPLVRMIQSLQTQFPERLKVQYFVDEEHSYISPTAIQQSIGVGSVVTPQRPVRSRQILVCGSDGFVQYIAGAKPALGQGPLGGLLAHLGVDRQGWYTWKIG